MQVIGLNPAFAIADAIATRSSRSVVADWARRVIRRHVRRTPDLLVAVKTEKSVLAAAKVDGLSEEVTARIVDAFRAGDEVFMPAARAFDTFSARASDTMDFMELLGDDDRRIRRIERLSWSDAEKMSEDWHRSLAKARRASRDIMEGVRKIHEFADGSFMAELTTKASLGAEGRVMGHCVGGYWDRVKAGDRRIVSLRDASGQPHVTVELLRAKTVRLDTGETVQISGELQPGLNRVFGSNSEWYSPQIRGKSNNLPVEKYAILLRQWLKAASIPTRERGFETTVGERMDIFSYQVDGKWIVGRNGSAAFDAISGAAVERLSSAAPPTLDTIDKASGLFGIIPYAGSVEAASRLFDLAMPIVGAQIASNRPANVLRFVSSSGIEKFVAAISAATGSSARSSLESVLIDIDGLNRPKHSFTPLVDGGVSGVLGSVVHDVSMLGIQLMKQGEAKGREDAVLATLRSNLLPVIAAMRDAPDAYHLVSGISQRISSEDIVRASFACGLGFEFTEATGLVRSGVRRKVTAMRTDVKKRRLKGEQLNLLLNQLADGWEERLSAKLALAAPGHIVGPEVPKPFDHAAALAAVRSPAPAKTYVMPRR